MPKHFVTFGSDHNHEINGKKVGFRTVARFDADNSEQGRMIAFELFGPKFCFEYTENNWKPSDIKYYPDGYVDLDINLDT